MKIFGRDKIIQHIWNTLEDKSVLLTAERRMGKTEVLKQMRDTHPEDYIVIFSDLEKISTPIEFVNDVIKSLNEHLSKELKTKGVFDNLLSKFGGTEIAGVIKLPEAQHPNWKALLTQILTDVCNHHADKKLLFLWDEVPYMLQKIESHTGTNRTNNDYSGLEVLDVLRALRMERENLRMVFTGSIGLHHVINTLKKQALASQPTNDVDKVNLPKLTLEHAMAMAKYRLVEKEKLHNSPDADLLVSISEQCDFIPFYIEKLIKHFASIDVDLTPDNVEKVIAEILVGGEDSWELAHFRSRLTEYYKGHITDAQGNPIEQSVIAKALLNHLAVATTPQSFNDCLQAINSEFSLTVANRDDINALLTLLVKDHYLTKIPGEGYQFTFTLIQRWWIEAEDLS